MQLSMKCSIAVHCLIFIHEAKGIARVTSPLLAESTGCNPVIIRNVISSLKKSGNYNRCTGNRRRRAMHGSIRDYIVYDL